MILSLLHCMEQETFQYRREIFEELGFENLHIVSEQEEPDPEFSTVDYPNPEEPAVFELAIELARQKDADLIMAHDPDADRVGIAVKDDQDEWAFLNGNQVGILLTDYILNSLNQIPDNGVIIKTIVTTEMIKYRRKDQRV
ncbi:hypothetical protein [Natroniella sp. ANB-PHB2]|uniref:hypothetical protein n=1 Tax=Natroniella sp. ANB-PHB2 TaxID=3384444 RepID=UPI0038D51655